jgi:EmrB/QacA subfamily drug resistance transporter
MSDHSDTMTTAPPDPSAPTAADADPRRWITLGVLLSMVIIVVLDTSVLNVAVPTMLRELDTTVPSLEWVISGYALTLASLLIIGGRLGDLFGHRRLFVIGIAIFGVGSAISGLSPNVGTLIVGEAIIEGIGAALMIPSTLALLSNSFHGRERAKAFAAWGATMGAASAFGPVVGGFLTTNYSWRWAFGINVIISPIAIACAMVFMRATPPRGERTPIDLPGALLVAGGTFLVVFSLSQGHAYGWFEPLESFTIGGVTVWPDSMPVSVVTFTLLLGAVLLGLFAVVEMRKERLGRHPLFEFSHMRRPTYRYGLITVSITSLGQLGLMFCLPIFLQNTGELTALETGLWVLPVGVGVVVGAQLGGRLVHRVGVTNVIRAGFLVQVVGIGVLVFLIEPGISFWTMLPFLLFYGAGSGIANSQLTNVILWGIPPASTGVASGANSTSRQIGSAFGAAILGTLLTVQTVNWGVSSVEAAGLPADLTDEAVNGIKAMGANWQPPAGVTPEQASTLTRLFDDAIATGTKWALGFAAVVFLVGGLLSLLIPQIGDQEAVESEVPPVTDSGTLVLEPELTAGRSS